LSEPADGSRFVAEVASRIGNLGLEFADIAGHLEDVTARVGDEAAEFNSQTAETMASGNRMIDGAGSPLDCASKSTNLV